MVIFDKMIIEGFGSIHDKMVFKLDRGGIFLVKGANGQGKTTMFSALAWALFKINLKNTVNDKVATWERLRDNEFKGTRVVLMFHTSDAYYMIARHLNYKGTTKGYKAGSKLMIFKSDTPEIKDSDMLGSEQHKDDQQAYINRILGMDSKIFLNSVLFGQRMKKLVEAENSEKRALFENLFELDFIQKAKDKATAEKSDLTNKINWAETKNVSTASAIDSLVNQIEKELKRVEEFEKVRKDKIYSLKENIKSIQPTLTWENNRIKANEELLTKEIADLNVTDQVNESNKLIVDCDKQLNELKSQEEYSSLTELSLKLEAKLKSVESYEKGAEEAERERQKAKANIEKYKNEYNEIKTHCPTCDQEITAEKIALLQKAIKSKIAKEEQVVEAMTKQLKSTDSYIELDKRDAGYLQITVNSLKAQKEKAIADNEPLKKQLTETKTKAEETLNELNKQLADIEGRKEAFAKAKKDLEKHKLEAAKISTNIENYKAQINDLEKEKAPIADTKELDQKLIELSTELETSRMEVSKDKKELERVVWWLTKGFGSAGIKAFVFNAMLGRLNSYVEKYAQRLGVKITFSVDLTKPSKPFTTTCHDLEGSEIDFEELSGGEKQRVDVALAFAMHDLISHTADTNLLIMDEFFEGLDSTGIAAAFDLVRVKASQEKTVYIITHHAILDTLNTKTITVSKNEKRHTRVD